MFLERLVRYVGRQANYVRIGYNLRRGMPGTRARADRQSSLPAFFQEILMKPLSLLATALLAAPALAQTYVYVPDSNAGAGGCNVIPFGTIKSSSTWVNQRYQTMATTADMGTAAGSICSLAFAACRQAQVRSFDYLKITMAQTTATSLSSNFAANLTTRPTVVFEGKPRIWRIEANDAWDNIGLQKSFLYIPVQGNVVVEVIAMGNDRKDSTATTGFHTGSRQRAYAYNWTGTPPSTGTVGGTAALKMRLGLSAASIDNFGMGCGPGPLRINGSGSGKIGTAVAVGMTGGPSSGPGLIWLGLTNAAPYPIDLSAAGLTGCMLQCAIDVPLAAVVFQSGTSNRFQIPLPNDRRFVCAQFYSQGLAIDSSAPGGLSLSDCLRVLMGL